MITVLSPHARIRRVWAQSLALLTAALVGTLSAADRSRPAGAIQGTVTHEITGAQLEGAEVSVEALGIRTLTGRDGTYVLDDLPPGSHTVRFSFTGLESQQMSIGVREGETARAAVVLGAGAMQLDAFVVASTRQGEAASITKQRHAANVVNVVAIDTFGDVADGNLGNFLVRLPGVGAEETSNGDIIGIKIRGTPAELSSVNLDGVRLSNAVSGFSPMGDRATMIDHIPAEFIKEVEVHKGLIPSMPADAIGGAANLITKSALDFREPVLTYKLGAAYNTYRDNLRNFKPSATLSYMTQAGRVRPLGVTLSLSYNVTEMPRDRVNITRPDIDGRMGQARTLAEVNTRERAGAGLKFDYRLSDSMTVAVKFNYAFYHYEGMREISAANATGNRLPADYNVVSRAQIEAGTIPRTTSNLAAGVAPGYSAAFTELLNATWTNEMGRVVRYARNYLGEISGEKKLGRDQRLNFQLSHNPSWFDADLPTLVTTLTNGTTTAAWGIGMAIDATRNRSRPRFIQTYGPSVAAGSDLNLYTGVYSTGRGRTEEEITNAKIDYTKAIASRERPMEFKAGINWRQQHRWLYTTSKSWRVVGADGVAMRNPTTGINDDLRPFHETQPGYGLFNNEYTPRDKYDILAVERAAVNNPAWFVPTTAAFAPPSVREATEDVLAAYVQGKLRIGRLGLLGGVRMERTEIEATGSLSDSQRPTVTQITRTRSYRDYFPSLHFSYEIRPNIVARASFSTGFARPGLNSLYPVTTVVYDAGGSDGRVTQNDPGLKPQQSKNYDIAFEWYFEPAGLISVGAFRKDITDFIASSVREIGFGPGNGFDGRYEGFDHVTTTNGGKAKIEGLELSFMQQLVWLPAPFDRLRVFANVTDLRTSGQYASGAEELAKFVPRTANAGLSYQWRAFGLRIAQRYTSSYLDGYNATPHLRTRFRSDEKIDVSFTYQVRRQVSAYVDVLNVFNKWTDQYNGGDPSRVTFSNVYGTKINFGVNGRF
ncbi:MAG: TonB-dependent receptor [Verrucomicrobia bacterium]|nr:TonB-dependent receptor [Verrucomicrobiota bacterium]